MTRRKRILIIDDDPDYVDGIRAILVKADYEVDAAYNARDGLKALQTKPPDLLLLDLMMGRGAEGVILARRINKDPQLHNIPTLIITGLREQVSSLLFPGKSLNPHFLPVGELIEKPVDARILLEKVGALLRRAEENKVQTR